MLSNLRRIVALSLLAVAFGARGNGLAAPNVVQISDGLVTSGQPNAETLASLSGLGFQAVVYLAPSTSSDAVKEEPALLAAQGIEFIHIPVPFDAPRESHLSALAAALDRLQGKKVLVHCQINLRASSLVFLYRVTHRRESAPAAYASVAAVWSPDGPWKDLLVKQLAKHRINFEPY